MKKIEGTRLRPINSPDRISSSWQESGGRGLFPTPKPRGQGLNMPASGHRAVVQAHRKCIAGSFPTKTGL